MIANAMRSMTPAPGTKKNIAKITNASDAQENPALLVQCAEAEDRLTEALGGSRGSVIWIAQRNHFRRETQTEGHDSIAKTINKRKQPCRTVVRLDRPANAKGNPAAAKNL